MKRMSLLAAFTFLTLCSIPANAYFGFSFNTGSHPVYAPAFPFGVFAPQPSVGLSMGIPLGDPRDGAPTLGFSLDVPLTDPAPRRVRRVAIVEEPIIDTVCRDTHGRTYWRVHNNSDRTIRVTSKTDSRIIEPGESKKVDHRASFTVKINDGFQTIKIKTTNHILRVSLDADDDMVIVQS